MFKFIKRLFLTLFLLCLMAGGGMAYYLYQEIAVKPAPEMTEANINAILGQESPVYYNDGKTQFGVIFKDVHRQYIRYEDIPPHFVQALLAAEDDMFFQHYGVDPLGIARAMLANFKAGKITQGGSTLTQQTAKNLFKREGRTLSAKFKEMLQAFRLEYHFPKEKILEFYCNQFYVSGNGHGLNVAARYFFDKEPKELNLIEAAFIAGSVKQPNFYNPFLQKNRQDPVEAKRRAITRVRYVLGQMREKGMLNQEDFAQARTTDLVFKQGKMSFEPNVIMDLVREGVGSPLLAAVLEEHGISNISTSGARIITTIDKNLQDKTLRALRGRISQLDVVLRGYDREEVQKEYAELDYSGDKELVPGAFLFGVFQGKDEESGLLKVDFTEGRSGLIATDGLNRMADARAIRRQGNVNAQATKEDKSTVRSQLQPGDKVYVSVRDEKGPGKLPLLDLERYPKKVEGGAIVLRQGAIKAMSGGMTNVDFNRATQAGRPMGSTFKTFVYAAALQLGWQPTDILYNGEQTYYFLNNKPYTPGADHQSLNEVSMSWAGVKSENRASVWLLYHLTDKLAAPALKELAHRLDMAPRVTAEGKQEPQRAYAARLRDSYGIKANKHMIFQAAYRSAVRRMGPDLAFEGRQDEHRRLGWLPYGSEEGGANASTFTGLRLMRPRLEEFRRNLHSYGQTWHTDYNTGMVMGIDNFAEDREVDLSRGALYRRESGEIIFSQAAEPPADWLLIRPDELHNMLNGMEARQREIFWQGVQLEGQLCLDTIAQMEQILKQESARMAKSGLYSLDVLVETRDFRVMLGIQYLIALGKACGVESRMLPVLPLALGANVVTLSEMARVYEAMVTGNRYDPAEPGVMQRLESENKGDTDGLALIDRIVMPDGHEVYRRGVHPTRLFDTGSSAEIANILQDVVAYGTGNYAAKHVRLKSADKDRAAKLARLRRPLPLLGKTGTANEFRNTAFLGYVPVLAGDDPSVLSLENGYTVGVYVGSDSNEPMVRGGMKVTGARGPLPVWSDIAQALVDQEGIADKADLADLQINGGLPLRYPELGQTFVAVDPGRGGRASNQGSVKQRIAPPYPATLVARSGSLDGTREFLPFWRHAKPVPDAEQKKEQRRP